LITLGDPRNQRGTVRWEPIIRSEAEADAINEAQGEGKATGLKGDLEIRGLIQHETGILIVDGRCTFPDGRTAVIDKKRAKALLAEQEHEKRKKHQAACQLKHMKFLPAVWTTCGAKGTSFMRLVDMLSE
jgi:hypothetical protein